MTADGKFLKFDEQGNVRTLGVAEKSGQGQGPQGQGHRGDGGRCVEGRVDRASVTFSRTASGAAYEDCCPDRVSTCPET